MIHDSERESARSAKERAHLFFSAPPCGLMLWLFGCVACTGALRQLTADRLRPHRAVTKTLDCVPGLAHWFTHVGDSIAHLFPCACTARSKLPGPKLHGNRGPVLSLAMWLDSKTLNAGDKMHPPHRNHARGIAGQSRPVISIDSSAIDPAHRRPAHRFSSPRHISWHW